MTVHARHGKVLIFDSGLFVAMSDAGARRDGVAEP